MCHLYVAHVLGDVQYTVHRYLHEFSNKVGWVAVQAERLAWLGVACQYHSKHLVSPSQPSLHAEPSALDCTQQQQVAPSASTAAEKLETSMTAGVVPDQCTESVQQLIQQLQVVLSGRFQQQCQALQVRPITKP